MAADTNSTRLINVCVGDEWYRYPSSFFLPGPDYRLQFVKSGFDGLLPAAFDAEKVLLWSCLFIQNECTQVVHMSHALPVIAPNF